MSGCVELGVTLPTLNIPGLSIGFALPNLSLNVDFCCKIKVGPFPDIGGVIPISLPTSIMVALNETIALFQAYIDNVLSYVHLDCPLD